MSKRFRYIFCYANRSKDWTQLYAVIFMGYFVYEMSTSTTLCDSQDWNLHIRNKARQRRETPPEVHALLKLQNLFTLLVELPGVWAGPALPCSPPTRLSSCRGSCFPAHPRARSLRYRCGSAAAGLAWLRVSALPVLSLAMPPPSRLCWQLSLLASVWVIYAPGACLGSRGAVVGGPAVHGSCKYQAPQAKGRVWLGGGDGQCSCLQEWSAVSAGPGRGVGLQCLLLLWIRALGLETGQRRIDEESVKAGERDDTFHTGELWFKSKQEFCLK